MKSIDFSAIQGFFKFPTTNPDASPGEILKFEKNEEGDYQINYCGGIWKKFEFSY